MHAAVLEFPLKKNLAVRLMLHITYMCVVWYFLYFLYGKDLCAILLGINVEFGGII